MKVTIDIPDKNFHEIINGFLSIESKTRLKDALKNSVPDNENLQKEDINDDVNKERILKTIDFEEKWLNDVWWESKSISPRNVNIAMNAIRYVVDKYNKREEDSKQTEESHLEEWLNDEYKSKNKTELQKIYEEVYMPIGNENLRRRRESHD